MVEALSGFASLSDPATREAFVHTARSVIDVGGSGSTRATGSTSLRTCRCSSCGGAKDTIIPVAHGQALADAVPSARFELFETSGHFPHMTEPDRLARVLADWVSTTEPAQLDPSTLTARLRAAR
jgi:pimeloyl-ACP methyl ester carboxylesterase